MFLREKSKRYFPLFVAIVMLIFAVNFAAGVICRAHPDPKVSDRFDAYLKPGVVVLSAPFLFLSTLFPRGWGHGNMLGVFVYFGAMLAYSVLLTLALFCIYEAFGKAIV
jgi:hypothetical protein